MFGNDRSTMRRYFIEAWRKSLAGEPLIPQQQVIASVIRQHPEYHALLETEEQALERDFLPDNGESNPFLHMGMHITLQEQIGTDRPAGIRQFYQQAMAKWGGSHQAEHQMMECLGKILWESQRDNQMPDEQAYLRCLEALLKR